MADTIPNKLATVSDMKDKSSSFNPGSLTSSDYITKQDVINNLSNGFDLDNEKNYDSNQLVKLEDVKYGLFKSINLRLQLAALFAVCYPGLIDTEIRLTVYEGLCLDRDEVRDSDYWTKKGSISYRDSNGNRILYTNNIGPESEYTFNTGNDDIILKLEGYSTDDGQVSNEYPFAFGINEFKGKVIYTISTPLGKVISTETKSIDDTNFAPDINTFNTDKIYFGNSYLTNMMNNKLMTSWLEYDNHSMLYTDRLQREGDKTQLVGSTPSSTYINRRGVFFIDNSDLTIMYSKSNPDPYRKLKAFNLGKLEISETGFNTITKYMYAVF